ncbi:uncharacterized protein EI90DRAFT_1763557 [Cantharellus anzutake]|uniref:uncharacterized protein n=1 Tax=Cantharellus anzutake TaxID=1750568 RepID=UPI001904C2E3|nr:uncharacterized protein EI90DRAFT_1763557 [Cantharellus anzutake]KAF8341654.1 hypothetical protein EI90DRAFT_1763557 [Cantharellus anzutake]
MLLAEISKLKQAPAEHLYVKSKSECLPGTRDRIQESLLKHLKEAGNRFIWLRGSPGTGKTAISMSVASTLKEQGMLAASFFWDKNQAGTGLDSIELFPLPLLANSHPSMRTSNCRLSDAFGNRIRSLFRISLWKNKSTLW